jgi:SOS-response transcriptional repressor LexA
MYANMHEGIASIVSAWVGSLTGIPMDQAQDEVLSRIRSWMQEVLETKGWTASHWARQAGTSATNITRVLDSKSSIMPTAKSVALLAQVAGSQPQLTGWSNEPDDHRLPVLHWDSLAGGVRRQVGSILSPLPSTTAFGVACLSDEMVRSGIFEGDMLVVEPLAVKRPPAGQVVVYAAGGTTHIGEVVPPFVTGRPGSTLTLDEVRFIGRVVAVVRAL